MNRDWILEVLDKHSHLDLYHLDARETMAQAILDALPVVDIRASISASASAVLATRAIVDGAGEIAREIGGNACGTLVMALQVGDGQ